MTFNKKNYKPVNLFIVLFIVNILNMCDAQMLKKEAHATVPQLIRAAGYPVERHRARTDDGYSLQLHRIPAGRRSARRIGEPSGKGKRAALLVHGMLGHSGDFVIMGPERSLAYLLADAGYDVWLGNLRGNVYSAHQNLSKSDAKFWDFSFHEHGKYDVPALIDKILNVTGLPKLMYVGYSMGTTSFFTMVCQRPEYNEKIITFVGLAPAVYMDNIRPLAELLLKTMNVPNTMRSRGIYSVGVPSRVLDFLIGGFCSVRNRQQDMCMRIIYSVVGEDYEQNDWEMSSVILARFQPASWRQVEHFGKIALTGVFTQWNKGLWDPAKPYNLTNVRVPVTLLYGENDKLTEKMQIIRLAEELKKTGMLHEVRAGTSWPKFNHLDFVFAKDVGKLLNKPLVKQMDKLYNKYAAL